MLLIIRHNFSDHLIIILIIIHKIILVIIIFILVLVILILMIMIILQLFRRQMLILRHYFSDRLVRPVHEALSAAAVNFVFENRLKVGWEDVHDDVKHNNQKCYQKIKSKHLK